MEYKLLKKIPGIEWINPKKQEDMLIVGALEGNQLVAYVVFDSKQMRSKRYMILQHIYVAEAYREQYCASQLLEYMELKFLERNISAIRTSVCSNEENVDAIENLLLGQDYERLEQEGTILIYSQKQMLAEERLIELARKKHACSNIWHTYRKNEKCYQEFVLAMKRRNIDLSELEFDHANSIFYKDASGNIVGCFLLSFKEESVRIKYVFADERSTNKQMMLEMLCAAMENVKNYQKGQKVLVYLSKQNYVDFFDYFFSCCQQRVRVWDYEKKL